MRHPGACDGQSGYSVPKVDDDIVEKVVLQQFAKFHSYDGAAIIDQAHNDHIALTKARCARLKRELTAKQKELADYQAEIIRVIRGESRFTEDMLTYLMKETQTAVEGLAARLEAVQAELAESMASAAEERKEYKKIKTWAELYRTCSFAEKKMILSRFIKAVHVYRDYRLDIEFNISFDAFKTLTIQQPAV